MSEDLLYHCTLIPLDESRRGFSETSFRFDAVMIPCQTPPACERYEIVVDDTDSQVMSNTLTDGRPIVAEFYEGDRHVVMKTGRPRQLGRYEEVEQSGKVRRFWRPELPVTFGAPGKERWEGGFPTLHGGRRLAIIEAMFEDESGTARVLPSTKVPVVAQYFRTTESEERWVIEAGMHESAIAAMRNAKAGATMSVIRPPLSMRVEGVGELKLADPWWQMHLGVTDRDGVLPKWLIYELRGSITPQKRFAVRAGGRLEELSDDEAASHGAGGHTFVATLATAREEGKDDA